MILTLHNLAKTYKLLPSEALSRSSTFDLYVLDLSSKWTRRQQEIETGKVSKKEPPKLSEQQMLDMIKKVRGEL